MQKKNNTSKKAQARERLALAVLEILTNEETPNALQDAIEEFVVSATDGPITKRWEMEKSLPAMENLLSFVEWKEVNHAEN